MPWRIGEPRIGENVRVDSEHAVNQMNRPGRPAPNRAIARDRSQASWSATLAAFSNFSGTWTEDKREPPPQLRGE